jgi:hypothetical protein
MLGRQERAVSMSSAPRSWAALAGVALLLVAGCGPSDGSAAAAAPQMWDVSVVRLPLVPDPTMVEQPVPPITSVGSLVWTPSGYRASGADGSRVVVWGSPDGAAWEVVSAFTGLCCERYESGATLQRRPSDLLLITSGHLDTNPAGETLVPVAVLRSSTDDGATWTERTGGPFGNPGMSVDSVDVYGDTVYATARVESADYSITPSVWRSTDLVTWQQVQLEGAPTTSWQYLAETPDGTVLGRAIDQDTQAESWYASSDDGATFEPVPAPPRAVSYPIGAVGDHLLVGVAPDFDVDFFPPDDVQSGPVLVVTSTGATWEQVDRNTGLWGDGYPGAGEIDHGYLVVQRVLREADAYCFDDLATCQQPSTVLVHVDDDLAVRPVAVDLEPDVLYLAAGDDGSLVVWGQRQSDHGPDLVVQRWVGPEPPATLDVPPPLPPPSDTSPILGFDLSAVEIGSTFRALLPLGACGGGRLEADDRIFIGQAVPVGPPYPSGWRVREDGFADGPSAFLLAVGQHPDADTFTFDPGDGSTITYRFHPAPDLGPECG